jgi:cell division protein FtsL
LLVAKKVQEQKFPCYDSQRRRILIQERREHNARTAAAKTLALGLLFVAALTAVSLVNHFVSIVRVNYEIGRAARELQFLQERQQHLRLEIAGLLSPDRLEQAGREIGMEYPDQSQFIILTAVTLEVGD